MSESVRRPTFAEIDLDNLAFNLRSVKKFIGDDPMYMAVVKADAYGHGSGRVAKRLEKEGIDWFGVALPEEGVELRRSGIESRILCLGGFWKGQEADLIEKNLTPVIYDEQSAVLLNEAARGRNMRADIHVKIDTGMGRVGVPVEAVGDFAKSLASFSNLRVEGMMTHFASADDPEEDRFTEGQIDAFGEAQKVFAEHGIHPSILDLANSAGAVGHPRARSSMVRLGGVLYGLGDDVLPQNIELPELKPVMSLYSAIHFLKRVPEGSTLGYGRAFRTTRDSIIATIPIGYQDGYMRSLSNKASAIVRGRAVPVVGRVSMDWTLLDVTDVAGVAQGDEVTLIGGRGEVKVTAAGLAALAGTISYEVTCGINRRVSRRYVEA